MTGDLSFWSHGLLFACLSCVLGIQGLVSAERDEYRWLSGGYFLQGLILVFIAGSAYFPGSLDLRIGGLLVTGLLIIQSFLSPGGIDEDRSARTDVSE